LNLVIPKSAAIAIIVLLLASLTLSFAYGVKVVRQKKYPKPHIKEIEEALILSAEQTTGQRSWYYQRTNRTDTIYTYKPDLPDALNLITALGPDNSLTLKVIDMQGNLVHQWAVDWFDIWPDATHLPERDLPKTKPGTHLHGTKLTPEGDVIFNFEKHGMVRMNACGDVIWKLPHRTHHSIFIDNDDYIWASASQWIDDPVARYPARETPIRAPLAVKVSQDGELLEEISVLDLLLENGYQGLAYMRGNREENKVAGGGDSLHLNDVEVFPRSMQEGFFKHGDIMISLRNINTVIVFDPATKKIKFLSSGKVVRQHDPDFIDGNTIAIFDNNHTGKKGPGKHSRTILMDAPTGKITPIYSGSDEQPFYSTIMGKHQLLDNGNWLITDSMNGRGFEIDADGNLIWEHINLVEDGIVGVVEEVERYPASYREILANPACSNRAD
jgi:hypothetical protein